VSSDVALVVAVERFPLRGGEPGVVEAGQSRFRDRLELSVPALEVLGDAPFGEQPAPTTEQPLVRARAEQPRTVDRFVDQRTRRVDEELAEPAVLDLAVDGGERVQGALPCVIRARSAFSWSKSTAPTMWS